VIYGDGLQTRDFVFVKDVVRANIMAAESREIGVFNIGSRESVTINELAEVMVNLCSRNLEILHVEPKEGDIRHSQASVERGRGDWFRAWYGLEEGLRAVKILNTRNIETNVTLVFSVNQAVLAAKAGATYVSPFIGRLDDTGHDGMQIVRDMVGIFNCYNFKTEIIVASIRHPLHVIEAAKAGAYATTIPFDVIEKMFDHPLTDIGLERFLKDWEHVTKYK